MFVSHLLVTAANVLTVLIAHIVLFSQQIDLHIPNLKRALYETANELLVVPENWMASCFSCVNELEQ